MGMHVPVPAALRRVGALAPFEPDILTPAQYADRFKSRNTSPERRLMFAVLEDAIDELARLRRRLAEHVARCADRAETPWSRALGVNLRAALAEAEAYFASDDSRWPFSFVSICDAFGLDVGYVRRGLAIRAPELGAREPVAPLGARRVNGAKHGPGRRAASRYYGLYSGGPQA